MSARSFGCTSGGTIDESREASFSCEIEALAAKLASAFFTQALTLCERSRQALPRPKLRKPISDPWEVEGELQGSSTGTTLALPSTTEGAAGSTTEAGTTITTHEGGAASSTDASAVEGDNDFLVLPKKMGQRKRPVSEHMPNFPNWGCL